VFDLASHLDVLAAQQQPDGGWGYAPGQAVQLEPTCLALLALSVEKGRFQAVVDRGLTALRGCAMADGTYRLTRGRDEAVWPTALALFARTVLGHRREDLRPSMAALVQLRGRVNDTREAAEVQDIDLELTGWPWAEGNFSWAEPTAWACLALRRAGYGEHPRVEEGLRLLLDRAHDEGGINYGNRRVLGGGTEPIPGPTALMLLAVQGYGDQPRVAAAVAYLLRQTLTGDDLEHLCWARLALEVHRDQPGVADSLPAVDERILAASQARAETPWVRPSPLREALTALALTPAGRDFFRLTDTAKADEVATQARSASEGTPLPLAGASGLCGRRRPLVERLKASLRGLAVETAGRLRQTPPETSVHIARAADYDADLAGILGKQYEAFRVQVPLAGRRVVLKPNLVEYHRDKVINTNPKVVAAAIELCRSEGAAEVVVAEGPGHWRNVEYLVSASGLGDVLGHYRVPFVDLNHDEPVKTPNLGRLTGLEFLYLSRTVASADVLISLPKLKTHHWAGATLSLKNLFGTLPGICYGWPKNELHWRGIDNSIIDIALTRTPDLAIVDAVVGMEGDGPLNGTARHVGALVMGCDPLAVDATCCRLMRLDPEKIAYLVLGSRKKLGLLRAAEIRRVGEPIEALAQPFETVPHFREVRLVS
jgi:uncharacterized protein (DUF362 family)